MHDGTAPYPDALATLQLLREAGKKVVFLSNSSSIVPYVAAHLTEMGITDYDRLITSGSLVAAALREDATLWWAGYVQQAVLAGDASIYAQYEAPVTLVDDPAQAGLVINIWYGDRSGDLREWQGAMQQWLKLGLPMACCNPDLDVLLRHGRLLCPGTLAAAYAAMGGTVRYFGKPDRHAYIAAAQAMGLPAGARLAMIGDNLQTDIPGGQGYGIDTIMILGGVHRAALGTEWGVLPDPETLAALCAEYGLAPTYAIPRMVV